MSGWRSAIRRVAVFIDRWQWVILLASAPFFLFPSPARTPWLLALPALWLAAWLAGQPVLPRTPLNGALLLFSLMLFVSLWTTFDIAFSLSHITGVLLGIAAYFAIVRQVQTPAGLWRAVLLFMLAGGGLALLGLAGINWLDKVPSLSAISSRLPALIRGLPGAEEGFSANGVAGALLFVIPVQVTVLVSAVSRRFRTSTPGSSLLLPAGDPLARWPGLWLAAQLLLLALAGGLLLLAQSRGAWLGFVAGMLSILAWRWRGARWALAAAAGLAAMALLLPGVPQAALGLAGRVAGSDVGLKVVQRQQLWFYGLLAIRDFPFTGMGLNVFRKALPVLYTVYPIPRDVDFVHAHNHLLQAAIDLGLPGLIAYLALWWGTAYALLAAWRATADPYLRAVSIGLGAGWVAEFVYGFTDVITFGAKLGIFFWFALALGISLYRVVTGVETRRCRVSAVLGAVNERAR